MNLISLRNISLAFGGAPLLDQVSLNIKKGERIGLMGRNGAGKSSFLKIVSGDILPDEGCVDRRQGLRVSRLEQDLPSQLRGTVNEVVAKSLTVKAAPSDRKLDWIQQQRLEQILSRLQLPKDAPVENLSGGVLRRVLLAQAVVLEPDILLLDEPTNHLDIESIVWLEDFLRKESFTLMFVTHDRTFLSKLANRIIEIDRGHLLDFNCDYKSFLTRRESLMHAEMLGQARFDKKLAAEEAWIRKGIKARRTRNEGRVRALKKMREEFRQRRTLLGTVQFSLHDAERSGRVVTEVKDLSFGYDEQPLIENFSTTVLRGERVGIIGPNGSGKTTLLKLILGELAPHQGQVRLGTNLEILYFDQLREQLNPEWTVQQNLSGDQDSVCINGNMRHVLGYLKDFLFTPDRARSPVRILSGGERNRLLLARLFTREANVLVLDEPTNDLDMETLDLLEELLANFSGTIFLVCHDRTFLNRIVTRTIALEGHGRVNEYVGGYDDWLRQQPRERMEDLPGSPSKAPAPKKTRPRKLSFKENRELEELPLRIETLEAEVTVLYEKLADPEFYRQSGTEVVDIRHRLQDIEQELVASYRRWEDLEELKEKKEPSGRRG